MNNIKQFLKGVAFSATALCVLAFGAYVYGAIIDYTQPYGFVSDDSGDYLYTDNLYMTTTTFHLYNVAGNQVWYVEDNNFVVTNDIISDNGVIELSSTSTGIRIGDETDSEVAILTIDRDTSNPTLTWDEDSLAFNFSTTTKSNGSILSDTAIVAGKSLTPSYIDLDGGDLGVKGDAEFQGLTSFSGSMNFYGLGARWFDNGEVQLGSSGDFRMKFSTAQTNNSAIFAVDDTSKTVILTESADRNTNYGHANQTNPTLFIHSADATDTTQWLSLSQSSKAGVLDSGTGKISSNVLFSTDGGHLTTFTDVDGGTGTVNPENTGGIFGVSYTATGAVTVTITSDFIANDGAYVTIKDTGGNASGHNITIATQGAETIDGQVNLPLNGDYDTVNLFSDGTNLFVY